MALPPIVFDTLITVGSLIFVGIYGILGTLLSVLMFLKVGREKFFRRVARPSCPIQALDPTYGQHNMITLKVNDSLQIKLKCDKMKKLFSSHRVSNFIMYRKVHPINP